MQTLVKGNIHSSLFALVLAAGLTFGGPNAAGQNTQLSPQQQTTVNLVKENLIRQRSAFTCFGRNSDVPLTTLVEDALRDIDPILVGKNVVFDKKWLDHIVGSGKPFSRQQFESWRNRLDKVYDCYEDFVGKNPGKIYIDLQPQKNFPDTIITGAVQRTVAGHAHPGTGVICLNRDSDYNKARWRQIARSSSRSSVGSDPTMHEIGHTFELWTVMGADSETWTEFLITYAIEQAGPQIGFPNRTGHRQNRYNQSLRKLKEDSFPMFSLDSEAPSAYRFYLFGLVDKVGWDTYKKAIRSYDGSENNYLARSSNRNLSAVELNRKRARDFFDRIEYFSGKPGVLRTLPDQGKLLDEHFNVEIANKPYLNRDPKTGLLKQVQRQRFRR